MKSILDQSFQYIQAKDHGPDYMAKKMEFYRKVEEARAKEKAEKVAQIKPRVRAKNGI